MSLSRLFIYLLLAFVLYKFVFNFLVPVFKMSWRVRRQIKEFQRQQQQQTPSQNTATSGRPSSAASANNATTPSPKGGEYIDFEEVRD